MGLGRGRDPAQETFPLEPVAVFIDGIKLTSDCGFEVRFWTQIQMAEEVFYKRGILDPDQFQKVAWRHVYNTLHAVPRMFALWAAKQVTDIAGTNLNLNIRSRSKESPTGTHDPHCPSCGKEIEDSGHVLSCQEAGRRENRLRGASPSRGPCLFKGFGMLAVSEQGSTARTIILEDNVWLAAGVKVLDGVTIGKDSIVGAGAVVNRDVPPLSIAVGVPAKVIRSRAHEANQAWSPGQNTVRGKT